jgi:hypothetical protein
MASDTQADLLERQLAAVHDLDRLGGLSTARSLPLDLHHNVHALKHPSKHDVLAIEPVGDDSGDEELRSCIIIITRS